MPDDDLFNLVEEAEPDKGGMGEATREDDSVGRRLRAQRRRQGISLYQAAQELRIDPAVLRAVEADDFSRLGAPVYIKGHLRKYAALLGLSPESVLEDYARTHELRESTPIVSRAVDPGRPGRAAGLLRGFVMLLVIVAIGVATAWWSRRGESVPAIISAGNGASTAGPAAVYAPRPDPVEVPIEQPAPAFAAPGAAAAEAGPAAPGAAAAEVMPAAPAGAALRIDVAFVGDSWVEMSDSDGDRLMYGLMDAGTAHSVEGTPPIEVLLGSAGSVRLAVDGEPYDVPPGSVRDDVARFSIQ